MALGSSSGLDAIMAQGGSTSQLHYMVPVAEWLLDTNLTIEGSLDTGHPCGL